MPETNPARILVVDDEPGIREVMRSALERLRTPTRVDVAASGEEASALLDAAAYDLVVSDYRMGAMSGADLLERVHARTPRTLRVLVTAHGEADVAIEAVNRGHVHAFLQKPWALADLLQRLDALLERRRAHEAERLRRARELARAVGNPIAPSR